MFPITAERRISLQNVNINQIKTDYGIDWASALISSLAFATIEIENGKLYSN